MKKVKFTSSFWEPEGFFFKKKKRKKNLIAFQVENAILSVINIQKLP